MTITQTIFPSIFPLTRVKTDLKSKGECHRHRERLTTLTLRATSVGEMHKLVLLWTDPGRLICSKATSCSVPTDSQLPRSHRFKACYKLLSRTRRSSTHLWLRTQMQSQSIWWWTTRDSLLEARFSKTTQVTWWKSAAFCCAVGRTTLSQTSSAWDYRSTFLTSPEHQKNSKSLSN